MLSNLPYAEELDIDLVRKFLLERVRLLPSLIIRFGVHFVCEWDLLVVARRQKTNFMDHPSKAIRQSVRWLHESFGEGLPPSRGGAAREPKDANPIMNLVWGTVINLLVHWRFVVALTVLHQKFIPACGIKSSTKGADGKRYSPII